MEQQNLEVEALADRLLEKLAQAIGELNLEVTTRKVKTKDDSGEITTEVREVSESIIDRAGLKQLTSVLKELQTIKAEITGTEGQEETGVILLAERMEGNAECKMQNAECKMQNDAISPVGAVGAG